MGQAGGSRRRPSGVGVAPPGLGQRGFGELLRWQRRRRWRGAATSRYSHSVRVNGCFVVDWTRGSVGRGTTVWMAVLLPPAWR